MRRVFNKIDKPLLFVSLISLIFGIMMIGSASSLKSYMTYGENYHFLVRQVFFSIIGIVGALIVIRIPIKRYNKIIKLAVVVIIGLLIYVLIKKDVINGITGWLSIGGFGIQPSEFSKTITILYLALAFEKVMKNRMSNVFYKILPFIVPLIFIFLIYKQPYFGTMMVLAGICFIIFLVVPYDKKLKLVITSLTVTCILIMVLAMVISGKGLSNSQKERFNYKAPCTRYRKKTGYQVCNGYIAINSGGLLGSGYGNSKQKYLYLPEAHTDFIFAIIIEEMGLIVGAVILLAYFIIIWRILMIARRSYNIQGAIICYGIATYISLHIIINLGGVLGLLPLTGIPLPFYTYGGSFIINLLISLGLVQRVSIENKMFEQKHLVR